MRQKEKSRSFRPSGVRRFDPPYPPESSAPQPQAANLTGVLLRIHERGYGFIGTGAGKPDYFILASDVPPEAWVKGARFQFTPLPPRPNTRTGRAGWPAVLAIPGLEGEQG